MIRTAISLDDIDISAEHARLESLGGGGVASFTGIVRGDGGIDALHLEAWPDVADAALRTIGQQAAARWPLAGATLIHRHGTLAVGARIVFVGAASARRSAALEACAFLIDWAKTKAPFWKREHWPDGSTRWVEARAEDDASADRWG